MTTGRRSQVGGRMRVAVIGVGYLGKIHAEKYAKIEDAELVGVVDPDTARAREVGSLVGAPAYGDFRELFGKVDAVSVVTPTESHRAIGCEFLSRGVHVMMEKPIAMNTVEADALINEAQKAGAVLQVGHLERFNGALAALGDRVKDPVYMECRRLSPFPNRSTDVDVVLDVMIHDLDIILNMVKSEIVAVEAKGLPIVTSKPDVCNARLTFRNGCVASITANRAAKEKVRMLEVFQKGASIEIDFLNQRLTVLTTVPGEPFGSLADEGVTAERKDSLLEELKSFLRACSTGASPMVSGSDGRRALEAAQLIQQAMNRP